MYNIGIRINHGTFHGVKMVTNHNFVSSRQFRAGEKVFIPAWDVVGEVYQTSHRYRPLLPTEVVLKV